MIVYIEQHAHGCRSFARECACVCVGGVADWQWVVIL